MIPSGQPESQRLCSTVAQAHNRRDVLAVRKQVRVKIRTGAEALHAASTTQPAVMQNRVPHDLYRYILLQATGAWLDRSMLCRSCQSQHALQPAEDQ
jgi:hypothetical protein